MDYTIVFLLLIRIIKKKRITPTNNSKFSTKNSKLFLDFTPKMLYLCTFLSVGRRQSAEDSRQKTEDRRQKTDDRRQTTEDRRQKTEGRRQKAEDRRQTTDDRRQKTVSDYCPLISDYCILTTVH